MAAEGVWVKYNPDSRGYANTFECSECGSMVALAVYDTECEYPYCPWCMAEMVETVDTVEEDE